MKKGFMFINRMQKKKYITGKKEKHPFCEHTIKHENYYGSENGVVITRTNTNAVDKMIKQESNTSNLTNSKELDKTDDNSNEENKMMSALEHLDPTKIEVSVTFEDDNGEATGDEEFLEEWLEFDEDSSMREAVEHETLELVEIENTIEDKKIDKKEEIEIPIKTEIIGVDAFEYIDQVNRIIKQEMEAIKSNYRPIEIKDEEESLKRKNDLVIDGLDANISKRKRRRENKDRNVEDVHQSRRSDNSITDTGQEDIDGTASDDETLAVKMERLNNQNIKKEPDVKTEQDDKKCPFEYNLRPELRCLSKECLSENETLLRQCKPAIVMIRASDRSRTVKKVELPNIDEVRRINSTIATAQVGPINAQEHDDHHTGRLKPGISPKGKILALKLLSQATGNRNRASLQQISNISKLVPIAPKKTSDNSIIYQRTITSKEVISQPAQKKSVLHPTVKKKVYVPPKLINETRTVRIEKHVLQKMGFKPSDSEQPKTEIKEEVGERGQDVSVVGKSEAGVSCDDDTPVITGVSSLANTQVIEDCGTVQYKSSPVSGNTTNVKVRLMPAPSPYLNGVLATAKPLLQSLVSRTASAVAPVNVNNGMLMVTRPTLVQANTGGLLLVRPPPTVRQLHDNRATGQPATSGGGLKKTVVYPRASIACLLRPPLKSRAAVANQPTTQSVLMPAQNLTAPPRFSRRGGRAARPAVFKRQLAQLATDPRALGLRKQLQLPKPPATDPSLVQLRPKSNTVVTDFGCRGETEERWVEPGSVTPPARLGSLDPLPATRVASQASLTLIRLDAAAALWPVAGHHLVLTEAYLPCLQPTYWTAEAQTRRIVFPEYTAEDYNDVTKQVKVVEELHKERESQTFPVLVSNPQATQESSYRIVKMSIPGMDGSTKSVSDRVLASRSDDNESTDSSDDNDSTDNMEVSYPTEDNHESSSRDDNPVYDLTDDNKASDSTDEQTNECKPIIKVKSFANVHNLEKEKVELKSVTEKQVKEGTPEVEKLKDPKKPARNVKKEEPSKWPNVLLYCNRYFKKIREHPVQYAMLLTVVSSTDQCDELFRSNAKLYVFCRRDGSMLPLPAIDTTLSALPSLPSLTSLTSLTSQTTEPGTPPQGMRPQRTDPQGASPQNPSLQGTNPQGTNRQGTNPKGTGPLGTRPQGTSLQGIIPQGISPKVLVLSPPGANTPRIRPQGTSPQGTRLQGTTPKGSNPQGTTPKGTNPLRTTPKGPSPQRTITPGFNPQGTSLQGINPQGTNPPGPVPLAAGAGAPGAKHAMLVQFPHVDFLRDLSAKFQKFNSTHSSNRPKQVYVFARSTVQPTVNRAASTAPNTVAKKRKNKRKAKSNVQ